MLTIKDGIIINKTQYTSSTSGVTYYTLNVAAIGCSDMVDVAVDQARFTQTKLMDKVNGTLGYARGRFELINVG
jgi:hypothetical protein